MEKRQGHKYELPPLPYGYADLQPYISEEQLRIHHDKHHLAYVNGANAIIDKLNKARQDSVDLDMKAALKEMSFHLGGHRLHSSFWGSMAPAGKGGGGQPGHSLGEAISRDFGSYDRFKKEFSQAAVSVEGSGWALLTYCDDLERLVITQVEKHNCNFPPSYPVIMALDVWEHAYYLDYKNDRVKFVEGFWNIVNWGAIESRLTQSLQPAMARAK